VCAFAFCDKIKLKKDFRLQSNGQWPRPFPTAFPLAQRCKFYLNYSQKVNSNVFVFVYPSEFWLSLLRVRNATNFQFWPRISRAIFGHLKLVWFNFRSFHFLFHFLARIDVKPNTLEGNVHRIFSSTMDKSIWRGKSQPWTAGIFWILI